MKVQVIWVYLEPVFTSPDITKHLPTETSLFKEVDSIWRQNMKKISQNPLVIKFT